MLDLKTQGVFSWNELMTGDMEAAKKFYTEVLGWTAEDMEMPGDSAYTVFKIGDEQVGGMMQTPPDLAQMGVQPYWGAYISVDDVDASARKVEELGGKVLAPPMDIESVGRFAVVQDPQGASFGIIKSV